MIQLQDLYCQRKCLFLWNKSREFGTQGRQAKFLCFFKKKVKSKRFNKKRKRNYFNTSAKEFIKNFSVNYKSVVRTFYTCMQYFFWMSYIIVSRIWKRVDLEFYELRFILLSEIKDRSRCSIFLGMLKVGAAHWELLIFFHTPILINLSTFFLKFSW